ncbi:hypothetical protein LTR65_008571 [Meristemomyces frigidus]
MEAFHEGQPADARKPAMEATSSHNIKGAAIVNSGFAAGDAHRNVLGAQLLPPEEDLPQDSTIADTEQQVGKVAHLPGRTVSAPFQTLEGSTYTHGPNTDLKQTKQLKLTSALPLGANSVAMTTLPQANGGGAIDAQPTSHVAADVASNGFHQSSPLRVPSRHDRDDASSISGKTTASSDLSTSKKLKKQVGLPKPSSDSVADAALSSALTMDSYDERPAKRPRLHESEAREPGQMPTPTTKTVEDSAAVSGEHLKGTRPTQPAETRDKPSESKGTVGRSMHPSLKAVATLHPSGEPRPKDLASRAGAVETAPRTGGPTDLIKAKGLGTLGQVLPGHTEGVNAASKTTQAEILVLRAPEPHPNSGDLHFDAALDLVEKSFAPQAKDVAAGAALPRKTGKPALTRTKIVHPQKDPSPQSIGSELPPATSTKLGHAIASATEKANQPTAKAIALDRGPTVIDGPGSRRSIAPTAGAHSVPEVPESPVESRDALVSGHQPFRDLERQQPAPVGSPASAPTLSGNAAPQHVSSNGGPAKPTAKRTKRELVKCSICRTVTYNDTLCKKCKNNPITGAKGAKAVLARPPLLSETAAVDGMRDPDEAEITAPRVDPASSKTAGVIDPKDTAPLVHRPGAGASKHPKSTPTTLAGHLPANSTGGDCSEDPDKRTHFANSEKAEAAETTFPETSCDDCQKHGRACTHLASSSSTDAPSLCATKPASVAELNSVERAQDAEHELDARETPAVTVPNTKSANERAATQTSTAGAAKVRFENTDDNDNTGQRPLSSPQGQLEPKPDMGEVCKDDASDEELSEPPSTPERTVPLGTKKRIPLGTKKPKPQNYEGADFPGNSNERPPGTNIRLIGMALCEAPDHRLQIRGIHHWIANNIPNYDLSVSKWKMVIAATVSSHGGDKGKRMFNSVAWVDGDSEEYGKGQWTQLQPGFAGTHERWDPVLKKPVSPSRQWLSRIKPRDKEEADDLGTRKYAADAQQTAEQREASLLQATRDSDAKARTAKARAARAAKRILATQEESSVLEDAEHMAIDESHAVNADSGRAATPRGLTRMLADGMGSSDDEPLAMLKRKPSEGFVAPAAVMQPSPASLEGVVEPTDPMNLDDPPRARMSPTTAAKDEVRTQKSCPQRTYPTHREDLSLAQLIKLEAENIDYSAKSLFDEWPEYRPENQFDKDAKIAEIKKRPSRKQMFKKPAMYSRLGSNDEPPKALQATRTSTPTSLRGSTERTSRPARKQSSFSTFSQEENVTHFDTLEEFFDLPANPIPFIHHGQLAYRDGTRDENGELPRAKVIYKTGPH